MFLAQPYLILLYIIFSVIILSTEVGTKSPAPATGRLGMLGGCRTSGANLRTDDLFCSHAKPNPANLWYGFVAHALLWQPTTLRC